jgi:hypothetical protein
MAPEAAHDPRNIRIFQHVMKIEIVVHMVQVPCVSECHESPDEVWIGFATDDPTIDLRGEVERRVADNLLSPQHLISGPAHTTSCGQPSVAQQRMCTAKGNPFPVSACT